jgi:uncharacterized membrane protein
MSADPTPPSIELGDYREIRFASLICLVLGGVYLTLTRHDADSARWMHWLATVLVVMGTLGMILALVSYFRKGRRA